MYQIDGSGAVSTLPTPEAVGTPGYFGRGNLAIGERPTTVTADFMNMVQGELLSILAAAGTAPSKTAFNQVLTSLQAMFGAVVTRQTAGAITENTIAFPGHYYLKLLTGSTPFGSNYNAGSQSFLTAFPNACLWMGGGSSDATMAGSSWHPVHIWFPSSGWSSTGFSVESDTGNVGNSVIAGLSFSGIAFGN